MSAVNGVVERAGRNSEQGPATPLTLSGRRMSGLDEYNRRTMTIRERITAYLHAIESRDLDAVATHLHPEVIVTEHPNKISPAGKTYDRGELRAAGERGKTLLASERYAVRSMIVEGDRAAVQIEWTGTLHDGRAMTGVICSIIELRDGLIWRQEQYDCFP